MVKIPGLGGKDKEPKDQNPGGNPPDETPPADQEGGGESGAQEEPEGQQADSEPEPEPETAAEKRSRLAKVRKEIKAIDKKTKSGAFGKADVERRRFLEAELEE